MNSRATLCGIAVLMTFGAAGRADQVSDPNAPAQLVIRYTELGLPQPSKDAKLVARVWARSRGQEFHQIGFSDGASVLVGTEQVEGGNGWEPVDPGTAAGYRLVVQSRVEMTAINTGVATAIQCEARGWHALAKSLLDKSLAVSTPGSINRILPESGTEMEAHLSPAAALAHVAWARECIALRNPDSRRDEIAARMGKLTAAEPTLANSPAKADLYLALRASLRPPKGAPGTIERMIDELVNVSGNAFNARTGSEFWSDPRLEHLAVKGFAAVPTLIEHLEDPRLTPSYWAVGGGSGPPPAQPGFLRVGTVVACILAEIAGDDPDHLVDEQWGGRIARLCWSDARALVSPARTQAVRQWWAAAQPQGEEAYMASHAFPQMKPDQLRLPYVLMFRILADRYPARLPEVFEAMIADAAAPGPRRISYSVAVPRDVSEVVNILAHSSLPNDQKVKLLVRAADTTPGFESRGETVVSASARELSQYDSAAVAKIRAGLRAGDGRQLTVPARQSHWPS